MFSVYHQFVFFFQAEDGIRDDLVTGVQTCALPICTADGAARRAAHAHGRVADAGAGRPRATAALQRQYARGARRSRAAAQYLTIRIATVSANAKIGRASCREREQIAGAGATVNKKQ